MLTYHRDVFKLPQLPLFYYFKQAECECLQFFIGCIGLWHMFWQINKTLSFTCNILNNTILVGLPKFITGTRHSLWFPGILAQTSQQSVGNNSFTIRLSPNAPQGCMLSLQLYSVHCIHDCTTNYPTNSLIKFADLTTAFWDESANREEIQKLTVRCWENNLSLHNAKTKELASNGACVERIHSFKFLEH